MELNEVAFRYRRNEPWVLQNVDLTVPRGRIVEVTGPNGAGKSTLLRLMAGLLHPRRGSITGRPAVIGYSPERFPRRPAVHGRRLPGPSRADAGPAGDGGRTVG